MNNEIRDWMLYQEDNTWAIPKRPMFVVQGTREEVDLLAKGLEHDARIHGGLKPGKRITAEPIMRFESPEAFRDEQKRRFDAMEERVLHGYVGGSFLR